ncbi:MAG: L,D-transpeptidase family protein [Solirubrobacterales bacterium]|nr:L,D-transpeptidase family protein [Solirubrobacterales bacterium]
MLRSTRARALLIVGVLAASGSFVASATAGGPVATHVDGGLGARWAAQGDLAPAAGSAIAAPSRGHGSTVARIVAPTRARPRLASRRRGWRVGTQTSWSHHDQVLLVLDSATRNDREWIKVLLAIRPTGTVGWIRRERVQLRRTRYWVAIRTAARRVVVYRGGERLRRFRAVVGAAATPTPRGLAAIYERNRQPDPHAFLGPWALSLTAVSEVLEDFGGGPGRVAIHGRAGASLADPLGSARSHGCIRINNGAIRYLARKVPVGAPVKIS